MKASFCFLLATALLALCSAAHEVGEYRATLTTVPSYVRPRGGGANPCGTAIATIYNSTYATIAFEVKSVVGVTMMHIHNGTLPSNPGGVVVWAFQSTLPGTTTLNPISGYFSGSVVFNPTTTGAGGLLVNNMAYFNVHSVEYPGGVIQANFVRRSSGRKLM